MKYRITLNGSGETFTCDTRQSVLDAMVAIGRRGIPSGCRGGGCGVCKVRIEQGQGDCLPMSRHHVTTEDEANGHVLSCCLLPRSDMVLTVLGNMRKAWSV